MIDIIKKYYCWLFGHTWVKKYGIASLDYEEFCRVCGKQKLGPWADDPEHR